MSTGLSLSDVFPLGYMNIGGVGSRTIIDDIYVTTNRRHGNARVRVIRPDEDGDYLDFAGSTSPATDHFEEVNDTEEDGDSTYLESGTVGHKESHYFEDINEFSNFDVRGVQHIITAKQDVEGVRAFKSLDTAGGRFTGHRIHAREHPLCERFVSPIPDAGRAESGDKRGLDQSRGQRHAVWNRNRRG
jgi:hypothetical protein